MKNQNSLADFPSLQTHCCRRFVLISPTCAMLSRENFLQNRMIDTDAIYGHNTGRTLQS